MLEYLFEFADALVLYNTAIKNLITFVVQSKQNYIPNSRVSKKLCYISCTCRHIYHMDLIFIAKLFAVYYTFFLSGRQPVKNVVLKILFNTIVWPSFL